MRILVIDHHGGFGGKRLPVLAFNLKPCFQKHEASRRQLSETLWHLVVRLPPSRKAALTLVSVCGSAAGTRASVAAPAAAGSSVGAHKGLFSPCPAQRCPGPAGFWQQRSCCWLQRRGAGAVPCCCGPGCAEGPSVRSCPYRQVLDCRITSQFRAVVLARVCPEWQGEHVVPGVCCPFPAGIFVTGAVLVL